MDKTKSILYVNACVRKESRTNKLAQQVLTTLDGNVEEIKPAEVIEPIKNEEFIALRDAATKNSDFSDKVFEPALQFAQAETIVIAAPYWDLSFPAILKAYVEQINVLGVTFTYTNEGMPKGLCKAKKLIYVTTAGGPIVSDEYGYGYIKTMAQSFYGIKDICQVKAEGLDIIDADVDALLEEAFLQWKSKNYSENKCSI